VLFILKYESFLQDCISRMKMLCWEQWDQNWNSSEVHGSFWSHQAWHSQALRMQNHWVCVLSLYMQELCSQDWIMIQHPCPAASNWYCQASVDYLLDPRLRVFVCHNPRQEEIMTGHISWQVFITVIVSKLSIPPLNSKQWQHQVCACKDIWLVLVVFGFLVHTPPIGGPNFLRVHFLSFHWSSCSLWFV
jgi:hypothetical protein